MPPKVGRVTSDGKRVFEPSHNDSPLGQNMGEPWADGPPAYIMDDSHVSRRFPTWYLKIGRGFTQFTTRRQERQSERRASNLFTTFLTSPPDLERFFQASKRQVPSFSVKFHPSVQNRSTLQLIYQLADAHGIKARTTFPHNCAMGCYSSCCPSA